MQPWLGRATKVGMTLVTQCVGQLFVALLGRGHDPRNPPAGPLLTPLCLLSLPLFIIVPVLLVAVNTCPLLPDSPARHVAASQGLDLRSARVLHAVPGCRAPAVAAYKRTLPANQTAKATGPLFAHYRYALCLICAVCGVAHTNTTTLDFHPDPYYKTYSSTKQNAACHRKRGPAGLYGAETSGCDSPVALVNATMDWVRDHIADDIDFVIWTGDSARHDNDEKIPRTPDQILSQNAFMVQKFREVFGTGDDDPTKDFTIPIVPTFGNNDIMPHNILLAGPNPWTMNYLNLWRGFIPEAQRHQFQQGGWFYVEVIPGKLAVISMNTM
jgi:hypothetical protein